MASLKLENGVYHLYFRYGGRQFHRSLDTAKEKDARHRQSSVERTLDELKWGRKALPPGADLWEFLQSDGGRTGKPVVERAVTLAELFDAHFSGQTPGAKEANTLRVERVHSRHLLRLLGRTKAITSLTLADLQGYVNARAREKTRSGTLLRAETIRKELETCRAVLRRAAKLVGVAAPDLPLREVDLPKSQDKAPFLTLGEIQLRLPGLSRDEGDALWERLFLDAGQVEELLDWVQAKQTRAVYFYPLMVFLARTGCRLSEALRSRVEDLDFDQKEVTLREKKGRRGRLTTRRVPMTARLAEALTNYLSGHHPGGGVTFARVADRPLRDTDLHDLRADGFFAGSKWAGIPGYHCLRHSYASNLAREGIDQRTIDGLLGHSTEAMRRRYRHLFPDQGRDAVRRLFGDADTPLQTKAG
jgi:integrase